MNRRTFIKRLGVGVSAALAVAAIPVSLFHAGPPTLLFDGPVTFRGMKLVFDRDCPKNTVYFLNPQTLWVNRGDGWRRPLL